MPRFYSIDFRNSIDVGADGSSSTASDNSIEIFGRTLGELIANLETATGIRLTPHDPPKYFRYLNPATEVDMLVDIHISRNDENICPKQDLDFPLEPDDIVEAGLLVC